MTKEREEKARAHYILSQLGDFAQHLVYRRASAVWEDPRWMSGGPPRRRLQDDLACAQRFKPCFGKELLQLARDINDRYGSSLNIDQIYLILDFVCKRHKVSHAHLTESTNIRELLETVNTAKTLCMQPWPPLLARHQKVLTLVVKEYEALVMRLDSFGLEQSDKVMKAGRFTGWLWEVAGLVKEKEKERGVEREREREGGKEE